MKQPTLLAILIAGVLSFPAAISQSIAASPAAPIPAKLERAKIIYDQHCAACHGANGDGNGPAAVWLFPKPRNFSSGLFKIQSSPAGSLPTDQDLFEVVTRGMPGSSMPSFTYLSEVQRREVIQYVKHRTAYSDNSGKHINRFDEAKQSGDLKPAVSVPAEPPVTLQALTLGKELFTKLQCVTCHGETGAGDGPSAATLKDNWGMPLPPRDFNTGSFRGGHTGRDLYLRIHNGMAGTPMPPFGEGVITPEERWALVLYVQSLRQKDVEINDILAPADGAIHVRKVKSLVSSPTDSVWDKIDPVRVPLSPLWPELNSTPAVAIRAVHDGKQLAILCQWRDPVANGAPIRVQDFQDAIALQFSMNGSTPFLGMGDVKNPVNIWQWKAGWQQEVDGVRPDVENQYVSMHVDLYFQTNALYRTAEGAGNIVAVPHKSPVEDANARGFGTFAPQSISQQNVNGKGIWFDGHWSVVLVRDLKSRDADDVKFIPGKAVPVAFAVWNGQQGDRNGRKVISNWYQFTLE